MVVLSSNIGNGDFAAIVTVVLVNVAFHLSGNLLRWSRTTSNPVTVQVFGAVSGMLSCDSI